MGIFVLFSTMEKIFTPWNNKKINSKKMIGLASLVLAGSLLTSCTISLSRKEHEYRRVNFTSNGNYYESSQFEPFYLSNKPTNSLIYYNEWEETADGNYSRIVKEYDVTDKSYDDIISLRDNKNINIDEVFGEPVKIYEQIIDNVSKEELEAGAYYEVTIYSENEARVATIKNGKTPSPLILLGSGLVTFLGLGGLIAWNKYDEKKQKKLTLEKREK